MVHLPNGPFHTHELLPVTMARRSLDPRRPPRRPSPPALRLPSPPVPRAAWIVSPRDTHAAVVLPSSTSTTALRPDHLCRRPPPHPPLSPTCVSATSAAPAPTTSSMAALRPDHPRDQPPLRRELPSAPSRSSLCSSAACPLLRRVLHNLPSLSTATATQGAIARHRPLLVILWLEICVGCCYFVQFLSVSCKICVLGQ
ncbi:hypothetical protein ACQJBY_002723 [Aegilops geniculata]